MPAHAAQPTTEHRAPSTALLPIRRYRARVDGDGATGDPPPGTPPTGSEPPGRGRPPSRARDLSRTRSAARRRTADTGRRHHIGNAPAVMSVLRPDGTRGTTRTAPIQLADHNDAQLQHLLDELVADMGRAAAALDFEGAAHLRDEVAAARAEVARRAIEG